MRRELAAFFSKPRTDEITESSEDEGARKVARLIEGRRGISLFSRSIHVRMVDCGSPNDVEIEEGLMNSPQVDCERFGIHFVASPRHADVLLASGPVTVNMKRALEKTYAAMPEPKAVVAAGDGAITGGLFSESYAIFKSGKVEEVVPVDIKVPGNPPTPYGLIAGILEAGAILDKKSEQQREGRK